MLYGVQRRPAAGMMYPEEKAVGRGKKGGGLGEDVRNLGVQFDQASMGEEIGSAES